MGTPRYEVLNDVPHFPFGIAASWVAIDPDDPPRFESEAAYLRRHGLLEPGEARRVRRDEFVSETVVLPEVKHAST